MVINNGSTVGFSAGVIGVTLDQNGRKGAHPHQPIIAADRTITGKGTLRAKMATNAAAIAHCVRLRSAREPLRCAACTTIAVIAGFMP